VDVYEPCHGSGKIHVDTGISLVDRADSQGPRIRQALAQLYCRRFILGLGIVNDKEVTGPGVEPRPLPNPVAVLSTVNMASETPSAQQWRFVPAI
jgi:hypothetical protein